MRTTYKTLSMLLLSQITLSTHATVFNGPYLSFGAGLQQNTARHASNTVADVDPGGAIISIILNNKLESYDNVALGEATVGYSKLFNNNLFTAADASLTLHPKSTNRIDQDLLSTANGTPSTILNMHDKIQSSNLDLTLALKMGWAATNSTIVYGLVGPQLTKFKTSSNAFYTADFGGGPFRAEGADSQSKLKVGLALGAGLSQHIRDNIVVGLKYTHTIYNTPSNSFTAPVTGGATGNLNMSNKAKLKTNAVIFNIGYYL